MAASCASFPEPSFENAQVQLALERAFPPPTMKVHVLGATEALLLKLAEYEPDDDCCGCWGLRPPAARTFEELAPATARHQWTLGIDGMILTCARKCGDERFDPVRDGIDLEQESVTQCLPGAVQLLLDHRWFVDGGALEAAAPAQSAMPAMFKKMDSMMSTASTAAPLSLRAPLSHISSADGSYITSPGDVQMQSQKRVTEVLVADEIRKLAGLMKEGLLTDDEFQTQKRMLLSQPLIDA